MKKSFLVLILPVLIYTIISCEPMRKKHVQTRTASISAEMADKVIKELTAKYGEAIRFRAEKGVKQAAALWFKEDGNDKDFEKFCLSYFVESEHGLDSLFQKLQTNFEVIQGNFNKIGLDLRRQVDLDLGPVQPVDQLFGSYAVAAHLNDDFFANKIAFLVLLNFPSWTLKEKNDLGPTWTSKQWAYARMGDMYASREPADLLQSFNTAITSADAYISSYNIYMGNLTDKNAATFFPADLKLISHWGLRDELKSHYADKEGGLKKMEMIYQVMKRIIDQSIPQEVINNKDLKWDPYSNKVMKGTQEIAATPEPDKRYEFLLDNFRAAKALDPYNPKNPTFIQRSFDLGMEISQADVEKLFTSLCSSPEVKEVAQLIKNRLGRPLQPFDIWYDGFKTRGSIPEEELNKVVAGKYPSREAFEKDLPNILEKLGFNPEKARFIASKVQVDAARGSGHAAGAYMKSDVARLRTRIMPNGMNYKGYNIAVHEFGHNVEQTITLQDVDYYMLQGVPTTAFTEALAFIFQKRDLDLLGIRDNEPNKEHLLALDNFWMSYEIMGVAMVDMKVWKWMYENSNATPQQLKEAVIAAAKEVWNTYYAEVFGSKDEPILAVYSHMIDNPLYLSSYPVGHLIDFQIERQIAGKNFADEIQRIYKVGRLTPEVWMKKAVGSPVSVEPILKATDEALKAVK